MKKIALDADGVLFKFMQTFDLAAEHILGRKVHVQQDEFQLDHYHLAKRVSTTDEKALEILEYMQTSGLYARLEAYEGVKEALQTIKEAGYDIYIVTALPEKTREMRLENLKNELDFIPKDIFCVGMGESKAEILKKLKPDIFIDDRIEYLASAPDIFHLAWVDQKESQHDKDSLIDVHVHSLAEWVEHHLPIVTKKLNTYYQENTPVQIDLKMENVNRKYKIK
jgi:phosphoglycolate phosphatase-like HAD superfamily hydrolase